MKQLSRTPLRLNRYGGDGISLVAEYIEERGALIVVREPELPVLDEGISRSPIPLAEWVGHATRRPVRGVLKATVPVWGARWGWGVVKYCPTVDCLRDFLRREIPEGDVLLGRWGEQGVLAYRPYKRFQKDVVVVFESYDALLNSDNIYAVAVPDPQRGDGLKIWSCSRRLPRKYSLCRRGARRHEGPGFYRLVRDTRPGERKGALIWEPLTASPSGPDIRRY